MADFSTPADNREQDKLSWISDEQLMQILQDRFGGIFGEIKNRGEARGETTLDLLLAFALAKSPEEIKEANAAASLTKSLQNNIGLMHQDILGSVKGWHSTGASGGIYDLTGASSVVHKGKNVYAELKMRHNTIRGKDKGPIWDELDTAVKNNGGSEKAVGYLIEVVPAKNKPYDVEWIFSAKQNDGKVRFFKGEHIRRIDGTTAYHIVTGEERAIFDLFEALPVILFKAFPDLNTEQGKTMEAINGFLKTSMERTLASKSLYSGEEEV